MVYNDRNLKLILFGGLIIQLVVAITATGSYHPDQHFQIIEFSSYQSGDPNGASILWEFSHFVRPTLQIYVFTAWHSFIHFCGIHNPYLELTILRIILGLMMFFLFNAMALWYFKNEKKKILYWVLLILNFSWFLPYTKVQFSSEIVSCLFFFGTIFLYDLKKDKNTGFIFLILVGFLLSLAFYFRFQAGFFIAGFGIWLIFVQKKVKHILPIAIGFIIGTSLNTWLDYQFYHQLVITPYEYYYTNIIEKRAAAFGTSSFLVYIGVFLMVVTVPPLSIILFFYAIKSFFKNYGHLLFITTMLFIVAHCFVGHKEERFMFPVLYILPFWIGWGLPAFVTYYNNCKKVIRYTIKTILILSIALNFLLLVLLILNPYSQSIYFTALLNKRFNNSSITTRIYYYRRSPFETPSGSPYIFYKRYFKTAEFIRVQNIDSVRYLQGNDFYVAATFDKIETNKKMMDSLGFKPVLYSSRLLWKLNEFLSSRGIHTINDIWVLYKKE